MSEVAKALKSESYYFGIHLQKETVVVIVTKAKEFGISVTALIEHICDAFAENNLLDATMQLADETDGINEEVT